MAKEQYSIKTIMLMLKHCEAVSKMLWVRLKELSEAETDLSSQDLSALSTLALGVSEQAGAVNNAIQKLAVWKFMEEQWHADESDKDSEEEADGETD